MDALLQALPVGNVMNSMTASLYNLPLYQLLASLPADLTVGNMIGSLHIGALTDLPVANYLTLSTGPLLRDVPLRDLLSALPALLTMAPIEGMLTPPLCPKESLGEIYFKGKMGMGGCAARMGIEALYIKPSLSEAHPGHGKYPYLLRGLAIQRAKPRLGPPTSPTSPWQGGFYLVAIMDWASRTMLSWRLSNTLDGALCVDALEEAG
jgi:hypothetical protein